MKRYTELEGRSMPVVVPVGTQNVSELLTVQEVANELGFTTGTVRLYLGIGVLTTYKFKHATFVDKKEVEVMKRDKGIVTTPTGKRLYARVFAN